MQRHDLKSETWRLGRFQVFARRSEQMRHVDPVQIPNVRRRFSICLLCLFVSAVIASAALAAETGMGQFRFGFSEKTFTDVDKNDAMAAMKVWADVIVGDNNISIDPVPRVLEGVDAIAKALRTQDIDAVTLPTDEYWKVRDMLDPQTFFTTDHDGRIGEEYLLLVHQDSGIGRVENLRGRNLVFFRNSRTSLAPIWLDTVLLQAGFPRAEAFCNVTQITKLAKVILPVFFRQTDACVVTRHGFEMMSELNPQVGRQLKVFATSQALVPSGFYFRRDFNGPLRETIIAELGNVMSSPAGGQVMTLFQSGVSRAYPISDLDSTLELLATHESLNSDLSSAARDNNRGAAK